MNTTNKPYPFTNGDTYFTIEEVNWAEYKLLIMNGENADRYEVVESTWDFVSEELHDENPNRFVTSSRARAEEYAEQLNEDNYLNQ